MFNTEFFKFLQENWGLYGLLVFAALSFVIYLPKLADSFTYFNSRKIQYINEALNSEYIDEYSKKILSENLTKLYLARSLGIKANIASTIETLRAYDSLDGNFGTIDIYRVINWLPQGFYNLPKIKLEEKKIELKKSINKGRFILNFLNISILISFLWFFYYSAITAYERKLFTYDYFNIVMNGGFPLFFSILSYTYFYPMLKKEILIKQMLGYLIDKFETS